MIEQGKGREGTKRAHSSSFAWDRRLKTNGKKKGKRQLSFDIFFPHHLVILQFKIKTTFSWMQLTTENNPSWDERVKNSYRGSDIGF